MEFTEYIRFLVSRIKEARIEGDWDETVRLTRLLGAICREQAEKIEAAQ